MSVTLKPISEIKARLGIEPNGRVQKLFTATCAKHMDQYVPFDKGYLAGTVINGGVPTVNVTENKIIYSQKYAKYVYYGVRNGKLLNYHTDMHEKAGPYWDRQMVSAEIDDVVKEVQKYVGGK